MFVSGVLDRPSYVFDNRVVSGFPSMFLLSCDDVVYPLDHSGVIDVYLLYLASYESQFNEVLDRLINGYTVNVKGRELCWRGYERQMGVRLNVRDRFVASSPSDLAVKANELINAIRNDSVKNPFVIGLVPGSSPYSRNSSEIYFGLKRQFIPRGIAEQFLRADKLKMYLSGEGYSIYFYPVFAYNIHGKAGFRTYTLKVDDPALEIGWDITSVMDRGKTISVGAAVEVYLNDGVLVDSIGLHFVQGGETMEKISSVVMDSLMDVNFDDKYANTVFLRRDGKIPQYEYNRLKEVIDQLDGKIDLPPNIILVEEIKQNPFRLMDENGGNVRGGVFAELSDNEFILLTTGLEDRLAGTARPLRIRWHALKGYSSNVDVAQATYNMSRIHLTSPYRLIRTSMTTYYAHLHAYYAGRNIHPDGNLRNTPWFT